MQKAIKSYELMRIGAKYAGAIRIPGRTTEQERDALLEAADRAEARHIALANKSA